MPEAGITSRACQPNGW